MSGKTQVVKQLYRLSDEPRVIERLTALTLNAKASRVAGSYWAVHRSRALGQAGFSAIREEGAPLGPCHAPVDSTAGRRQMATSGGSACMASRPQVVVPESG